MDGARTGIRQRPLASAEQLGHAGRERARVHQARLTRIGATPVSGPQTATERGFPAFPAVRT